MLSKDTPHETTRTPCCPQLPPEIWINIFRFHTSLTHLWTTCRRVSTTLRACAEHAFSASFLSEIQIVFYLDKYNLGGRARFEVVVTFDRVGTGESEEFAWFSERTRIDGTALDETLVTHPVRMKRWEDNIEKLKPELPNYTIRIGTMVNDTAIPGLSVDVKKREIVFKWRKALDLFFREETHREALWTRWKAEGGLPLHPGREQDDQIVRFGMRRLTRRARLREAYAHDEQMLWAIASLQHFSLGVNATLLPDLPGAGLGEKWFGSVNMVQELYLDETNCFNRIQARLAQEGTKEERETYNGARFSCARRLDVGEYPVRARR